MSPRDRLVTFIIALLFFATAAAGMWLKFLGVSSRVIEFINNVVATLIGVLAIYLFYIMLYKGRYE